MYLTVQYAHFLLVVYRDMEGARSAYRAALEKLPGSQTLWEGAIHLQQIVGATVCLCSPSHCSIHACTDVHTTRLLERSLQCSLSLIVNGTASSQMMSIAKGGTDCAWHMWASSAVQTCCRMYQGLRTCFHVQLEEFAKTVLAMYEKAIASADLLPSDREELSARACTFADMCGSAAVQEEMERRHAARRALLQFPPVFVGSSTIRPDVSWLMMRIELWKVSLYTLGDCRTIVRKRGLRNVCIHQGCSVFSTAASADVVMSTVAMSRKRSAVACLANAHKGMEAAQD